MASNERNALAELAERLGEITSAWRPSEPTGQYAIQSISYVRKASRIIAELAKVVDCKHPDKFMPLDKPYEDITIYCPVYNGLYMQNSLERDESDFILDLANAAWNCRAIAEE